MNKPITRILGRDENACMYTDYFQLSEHPFSLTPDPRYLFMSERHREGLAHLLYGVQQPGGFVQLTGDVGSGKTTLSRCLVRQLPPETDVALILNPRLTALELLASVCDELRIRYPADTQSIKVFVDALNEHLLEAHARRRRTVLIIDEAQNLQTDVLEQIRLLTNLETSQEKLLQIILIGQPELLSLLDRKGLRQLAQRITARYHLLALSRHETYAYIQHRLLVAGRRDPLFTRGAMRCVYRLSGGVPRLINIICDRALLGAYATDRRRISTGIVRRACRETRGSIPWHRKAGPAWIAGILVLLMVITGTAVFFFPAKLPARRRAASPAAETRGSAPIPSHPLNIAPPETRGSAELQRFVDLVSGSRDSLSTNLSDLYVRWGIKTRAIPGDVSCKNVKADGFECLSLVGSWPKLRRYGIPAILEIVLPSGVRRHATVVGLSREAAVFVIGGREYTFPFSEVDQVWDGSFTVLWKPPFETRQLAPGARGEEVRWLRRTLDTLEKKTPGTPESDLYDDELRQRIVAFQKDQSLLQDGFVGNETLVRLTIASGGQNTPLLSNSRR